MPKAIAVGSWLSDKSRAVVILYMCALSALTLSVGELDGGGAAAFGVDFGGEGFFSC